MIHTIHYLMCFVFLNVSWLELMHLVSLLVLSKWKNNVFLVFSCHCWLVSQWPWHHCYVLYLWPCSSESFYIWVLLPWAVYNSLKGKITSLHYYISALFLNRHLDIMFFLGWNYSLCRLNIIRPLRTWNEFQHGKCICTPLYRWVVWSYYGL